ncbi:hypothetical protein ACIBHX_48980 [Nonomuraea sp. NPDC050536]|uniref:hypothetical protein n=1 Tax=Nonomuraea sp. NPDC050536 TaxID=3364366 RepID=UPI0037C63CA7
MGARARARPARARARAGTGKLTAALRALGAEVIAVEPDPAMLAELRSALPDGRAPRPRRRPPQQAG